MPRKRRGPICARTDCNKRCSYQHNVWCSKACATEAGVWSGNGQRDGLSDLWKPGGVLYQKHVARMKKKLGELVDPSRTYTGLEVMRLAVKWGNMRYNRGYSTCWQAIQYAKRKSA